LKKGRVMIWFRVSAVIVALLTIWVWQRITVVKMIRNNDLLRAEVQAKKELKDKVGADIARLLRQGRIEQIAAEMLGLTTTRPGQQRISLPPEFQPEPREADGWQRLNNSLRKLAMVSISQAINNDGTQ